MDNPGGKQVVDVELSGTEEEFPQGGSGNLATLEREIHIVASQMSTRATRKEDQDLNIPRYWVAEQFLLDDQQGEKEFRGSKEVDFPPLMTEGGVREDKGTRRPKGKREDDKAKRPGRREGSDNQITTINNPIRTASYMARVRYPDRCGVAHVLLQFSFAKDPVPSYIRAVKLTLPQELPVQEVLKRTQLNQETMLELAYALYAERIRSIPRLMNHQGRLRHLLVRNSSFIDITVTGQEHGLPGICLNQACLTPDRTMLEFGSSGNMMDLQIRLDGIIPFLGNVAIDNIMDAIRAGAASNDVAIGITNILRVLG